jgi:hypothetical protein
LSDSSGSCGAVSQESLLSLPLTFCTVISNTHGISHLLFTNDSRSSFPWA